MQSDSQRQLATANYLRQRRRRRLIVSIIFVIFVASVVRAHTRSSDDWADFNHRSVLVTSEIRGDTLTIRAVNGHTQNVKLIGVVAPTAPIATTTNHSPNARDLLVKSREATLLLAAPQTRDDQGRLLAYVFIDNSNLSVGLTRAGMVYADRLQFDIMRGLIDPAESEARKKRRGIWQNHAFEHTSTWRLALVRAGN